MVDHQQLQMAFPKLTDIRALNVPGGQKQVFRARMATRELALKVIHKYEGDAARTEREIAAVAKLKSSYVPAIVDCGIKRIGDEDRYYIIEQFIDGQSYRNVLRQRPVRLLGECLELCRALLGACVDFENARLVHRDIKPENLMVGADGKLWVIDFGLARHLDLTSITVTQQQFGVGTWGYMAPEQFRNMKPHIDSRADLFSVGVVLYESAAGHHPYARAANDVLGLIRRMENEDLPSLTLTGDERGEFSDFIAQLTQRFPSRRPQSAAEAWGWFEPLYNSLRGR